MSLWENPDYRAGFEKRRTTSTDIFGLPYKKGVADREFKERHPLFGKPKKIGWF